MNQSKFYKFKKISQSTNIQWWIYDRNDQQFFYESNNNSLLIKRESSDQKKKNVEVEKDEL